MSNLVRAFIVGYTGETGKALVKTLAKDQRYESVKLIGRRETSVDYGIEPEIASKKFSQHVIDFERLDDHQHVFEDTDVGFCALGTTVGKSGRAQMRVIDHDYTVKIAELALASSCKEFHVVTSRSANSKSFNFYLRLKGEIENDLKACLFPNYVAVYRPAFLLCDRVESRPGERFLGAILKPLASFYPDFITTKIDVLAKAMANAPFCLASVMRKKAMAKGDEFDPKYFIVETNMIPEIAADSGLPTESE